MGGRRPLYAALIRTPDRQGPGRSELGSETPHALSYGDMAKAPAHALTPEMTIDVITKKFFKKISPNRLTKPWRSDIINSTVKEREVTKTYDS